MNDHSKPVSQIEKELLDRRNNPRVPLKPRTPAKEVTPSDAGARTHADFPKTIKYLGQ